MKNEKAIITVLASDKVGLVYNISKILFENKINILDISQKVLTDEIFSMVMTVELPQNISISELREKLNILDLEIFVQGTELFNCMHKL